MTNSEKMKRALLDVDYRKWLRYTSEYLILEVSDKEPHEILIQSFFFSATREGENYWFDILHALKLLQ
jgi:hypothetical protein